MILHMHIHMSMNALKKVRKMYKMYNSNYLWDQERFMPFTFCSLLLGFLCFYHVSVLPYFQLSQKEQVTTETETLALCSGLCPAHPGLRNTPTHGWASLLCWREQKAEHSEAALPWFSPSHFQRGHSSEHVCTHTHSSGAHVHSEQLPRRLIHCPRNSASRTKEILVTLIKLVHSHTSKQMQQQ